MLPNVRKYVQPVSGTQTSRQPELIGGTERSEGVGRLPTRCCRNFRWSALASGQPDQQTQCLGLAMLPESDRRPRAPHHNDPALLALGSELFTTRRRPPSWATSSATASRRVSDGFTFVTASSSENSPADKFSGSVRDKSSTCASVIVPPSKMNASPSGIRSSRGR